MVRGYRGGYLPNRRREIEKGLRDGEVRAVVATNALELGIDIGALDVAVLAGYPGTIAATWQRAGRAGRRAGQSAAVLVASSAPLDQFVVRNPSYFFDASPEHALINPDNLQILLEHIKCAAFELPFGTTEVFGRESVQEILRILSEEGLVHLAEAQAPGEEAHWHWTSESYPADAISLRSISSDNFVVVDSTDSTRVIGETDFTSAPSTLHEKAIYIVEGTLYQVERLDFENRKAFVRQVDCDYYTDAIRYDRVTILDTFETAPASAPWSHGEVHVVSRVVGFKKIKFYTNENVGSGELDLPEQEMHTTGCWFTIPRRVMTALPYGGDDRRDGVRRPRVRRCARSRSCSSCAIGTTSACRSGTAPRWTCRRPRLAPAWSSPHRRAPSRDWAVVVRPARRRSTTTSRACSSTTTTRAASACPSRSSRCARRCSPRPAT